MAPPQVKNVFLPCFATSSHPFFSMRNRASEREGEKSVTEVEGFICDVAKSPLSPRGLLSFPQFRVKNIQAQSSSSFSKGFYPTLLFLCVEFYRRCCWLRVSERVSPSNFFLPSFPPISSQDDVFRQHSHSWLNRGWDYYNTGCVYINIVRIAKGCPLTRPLT